MKGKKKHLSVAFRVQTACTRFFSFFFPAPLYTRMCRMRGPVYRNAFFFFSSHIGGGAAMIGKENTVNCGGRRRRW